MRFKTVLVLLLIQLLASGCVVAESVKDDATESTPEIVVTVLGSGTPIPSPTQFGTTILVQAGGKNLMFDCGRGCTSRLAQLDPSLIKRVDHLFITHLHSDHIVGIDDLWLNGWTQGRNEPLKIWGPKGTRDMMAHMRETFAFDIHRRVTDGLPATTDGLADRFTELTEDGVVYDSSGVKVTAFTVDHATVKPAWGFRIDYNGRSVMISGDTAPTENLYRYGKGADVILHEVISPAMTSYLRANYSPKQVARVISYHTEARDAADIFLKSETRLAVYYHTGIEERSARPLIRETREIYDGPLAISHDLFQIRIGDEITTHDMSPKPASN